MINPLHSQSESPIAHALQPLVDSGTLAGAVAAVASQDALLDLQTVGCADLDAHVPMQANSVFWIASQTKTFTAAALLMLIEEGKVALDAPVQTYLPEFADLKVALSQNETDTLLRLPHRPITVRDLLRHTSGLPFSSIIEHPSMDILPLETRVRSYAAEHLRFEPGTAFAYSNEGVNIAGRIIEVVAEMPYETFLSERLLRPLGMADTTLWPDSGQLSRLAKTYKPGEEGQQSLIETRTPYLHYPLSAPTAPPCRRAAFSRRRGMS